MFCIECEKEITDEDEYYNICGNGNVICGDCFDESTEYKQCNDCGCVDTSDNMYEGFCEGCYEHHSTPEWMADNGGKEDFMDTYDPDRDDD